MVSDQVYWYNKKGLPRKAIDVDYEADVVVVGGGMAGLMCAHELVERGRNVIIIEKDFCGAGASGKSSGFISPDSELELSDLIANYGKDGAKQLWNFVSDGVTLIKDSINRYQIECDFQVQDSLYIATNKKGKENIAEEHRSRQSLHFQSRLYDRHELESILGSSKFYSGVRYPDTFGIDGFGFCSEMAKRLEEKGVQIFEQSNVTGVAHELVRVGKHVVKAKAIVLCTDRFLPELGFLKDKIFQLQTFLAISKPMNAAEVKKIFPGEEMMVWDSKLIYNYFRITGEKRLLLGGANMLHTYTSKEYHHPEKTVERLNKFFDDKFPQSKIEWECAWPGMVGVSKDVIGIAGQSRSNSSCFFIAAASGLPWAAAFGKYIAEKIVQPLPHPLDEFFSPYRQFPVKRGIEKIIGKPLSFLIAHFTSKYLGKM